MLIEDGDKLIVKICGFGTEPVRAIRYTRGTIPIDYNVFPNADLFNQIGRTQKGDVFCVAVVLYQMVAGSLPFDSQSTVKSHVEPVSKVRAELPGVGILDDVFKKALDSDPNNQYENISALEEAMKEWIRLIHGEVVPSSEKGTGTSAVRRWTKESKKPEVAPPAAAPIPVEDHSHGPTKSSEWPKLPSQSPAMSARRWTREVQDGEPDEHEHLREDIAGLKNRQVKQEKTMIIQLAKAVGGGRSPVRVMVETGLLIVGGCLCLFAVIHYGFTNYDSLMDQYWNASRRLNSQISGTEWTPSSGSGGFDYKKDSNYQPWSNNEVVGEPRVVGPDGILETK
jgi:serine/threonine protein kinase